jgi:universal stress protein A
MATRRRVAEYHDAATECGENQQQKQEECNTVAGPLANSRLCAALLFSRSALSRGARSASPPFSLLSFPCRRRAAPHAWPMAAIERTLIVGIDYSDFCIPALDQALQIAATNPATRLVPLLALPEATPSRLEEAEAVTEDFVARAKDNLVRLVQTRAGELGLPPGHVFAVVCFGEAADCLLARARELGAELICVGTHSRRGFDHLLMGSVAEEVVRQAPCSVLVARKRPTSGASMKSARAETGLGEPGLQEAGLQGRAPSDEEFLREALEGAPAAGLSIDTGVEPLSEPHLDAGQVVLHLLDVESGYTFLCSFSDFSAVRVEPLEGAWVPQPPAEARARAARFALVEAGRNAARFSELFEELTRRKQEYSRDPAAGR